MLSVVRGIAAAVIERLSKRAHDAERGQARRLSEAYARWPCERGETEETEKRERDRGLLGTREHNKRRELRPRRGS